MRHDPVVVCESLRHRYARVPALEDISLRLHPGESTALIGPDGVGKSTLLGLIAGVRKLQGGEISVFGGDLRSQLHRNRIAHRIAYMPQGLGRNLYPSLSVAENLDFVGRLFSVQPARRRQRIDRLLQAVGLEEFPDRPAGQLSGGMKQKVSLCSALLHDPELLVLDEPTTGIDPLSRRQFWSLIDGIRAERPTMTLIVSTSYMDEAEAFDRVAMLDAGRLMSEGSVSEILDRTGSKRLEDAFVRMRAPDSAEGRRAIPPRRRLAGPPIIEAEGLTRRFGSFTAVDDVSFRIEQGEIFGFLGSNGCGKTTTMKMLTGLLPATAGRAWMLGTPVEGHDLNLRLHIGYMSQSFSLYRELSVRANLELHARLYRIPPRLQERSVSEALTRFDLVAVSAKMPESLPLGQRQRLQLAVACLHKPKVLILDEPTSGVDPVARDRFWDVLGRMSREDGVTIFVSTHFMGEALLCDRISLMHGGRVLAIGTPTELMRAKSVSGLDAAFIRYIEDDIGTQEGRGSSGLLDDDEPRERDLRPGGLLAGPKRAWAFARREAAELIRDRIRLAFAFLGPIILTLTFGYGISFDVEDIRVAALDRDQSAESRRLIDTFAASPYFDVRAELLSDRAAEERMRSGDVSMLVSVPPGFGRDVLAGHSPEIGIFVDGSLPFTAETTRGYVQGVFLRYYEERAREMPQPAVTAALPFRVESRFRYNQDFKSVFALMPGILMINMAMIPAIIAAIGVVREREMGSISNLYTSPASVGQFLVGKQLPYIAVSFVSFLTLVALAVGHFGLTVKGSTLGLLVGGLFYVFATTAFGILVSSFTRSQVAALIATAVLTQVPVLSFSGFLSPAAALEGGEAIIGQAFPALYFQNISIGSFAKAQSPAELLDSYVWLVGLGLAYLFLARLFVRKQEA